MSAYFIYKISSKYVNNIWWSHTTTYILICYYECGHLQPSEIFIFTFEIDKVGIFLFQLWAAKVFGMYTSWARKQGCKVGLIEKISSMSGHVRTLAMEIESEYMFGILSGEKGMHRMIYSSLENSDKYQVIMLSIVVCFIRIHQELLCAKFRLCMRFIHVIIKQRINAIQDV